MGFIAAASAGTQTVNHGVSSSRHGFRGTLSSAGFMHAELEKGCTLTEAALHYLASLLGNRDGEQERMPPLSENISSKTSSHDLFRSSFPVKHMPAMTTGSTRL